MEAILSSETSDQARSTRRHIPEDGILEHVGNFADTSNISNRSLIYGVSSLESKVQVMLVKKSDEMGINSSV
jgi:hypothetical protein